MTERLESAWQGYVNALEEARAAIKSTDRFGADPDYERRLYRNLMQAQAMAYNMAIVPRVDRPRVFTHTTYQPDFYTLGMACPDFHYIGLFLDGRRRYRITGRRGDVVWMAAQVQSHMMGDPNSRVVGDFDFAEFATDGSGRFDVTVGTCAGATDHIPLEPSSRYNFIWVRRILGDWADDAGEFRIEALDDGYREPQADTIDEFAERIDRATHLTRHLLKSWSVGLYDWYADLAGGLNRIAFLQGARLADKDVGSLAAYYAGFLFSLRPNEALIIEGTPPDGVYWGFQLGDVWTTSLDFIYHQSDINMRRVAIDADGKYRVVICRDDPGLANWLDPEGNPEGIGMMRVFRSPARPALPVLRVVTLSELDGALPADTRRITSAERRTALLRRETLIREMYGQ